MRLPLLLWLAVLVVPARQCAEGAEAEPLKLDLTIGVDNHGDGSFEARNRLSARDWLIWQANRGNHPDLILRDLKRDYASFDFDPVSFHLDKDEINRAWIARLRCGSIAELEPDGSLAIPLGKAERLVTHSGHEWIFSTIVPSMGDAPGIEQMTHILLPPGETDTRVLYPDSADQKLVFRLPHPTFVKSGLLILSICLASLGFLLIVASCFVGARKAINPPMPITCSSPDI